MQQHKKGSGVENLMLLAVLLFFLSILILAIGGTLQSKILEGESHDVLNSIAITANTIRDLGGEGSEETIMVRVPKGIQSSSIEGSRISYDLGAESVDLNLGFPVVGNLPSETGNYHLSITSVTGGAVKIGSWPYLEFLIPSCVGHDQLPMTVTLKGHDFQATDTVWVDGSSIAFTFLDGQHHEFTAEDSLGIGDIPVLVQDQYGNSITSVDLTVVALSATC